MSSTASNYAALGLSPLPEYQAARVDAQLAALQRGHAARYPAYLPHIAALAAAAVLTGCGGGEPEEEPSVCETSRICIK